jgi:hypothetical protein
MRQREVFMGIDYSSFQKAYEDDLSVIVENRM